MIECAMYELEMPTSQTILAPAIALCACLFPDEPPQLGKRQFPVFERLSGTVALPLGAGPKRIKDHFGNRQPAAGRLSLKWTCVDDELSNLNVRSSCDGPGCQLDSQLDMRFHQ